MPPVKIVVDSTVDLPPELMAELDITVVPCLVRFGDQTFREGVDITRAEFFARLQTGPHFPSTAAPAPGVFEDTYRRLAAETEAIVSIHLSSQHSGIFNSARLGAEAVVDSLHVVPVDSGQISLGMGLMAMVAAEAAREGASLAGVLDILEDLKPRTHLFAIPRTLDNLRRSGRITQIVAHLGNLLRIKPILHVHQGQVLLQERVHSWGRAQQHLIQTVRSMAPFERVVLAHIRHPEAAGALGQALADLLPPRTFIYEAGVIIGIHVGVGAVGIALIRDLSVMSKLT
jgi:DegV family protein with EDD domain